MPDNEQGQHYPDGSEYEMPSQDPTEQLGFDSNTEAQVPSENNPESDDQELQKQPEKVGDGALVVAGVDKPVVSDELDDSTERREDDIVDRINKDFIYLDVAHNSNNLDDIRNNLDRIIANLNDLIDKGADVNELMKKVDLIDHFRDEDHVAKYPELLSAIFASSSAIDKLSPKNAGLYLSELLAAGVDADKLVERLEPPDIQYHLDELLAAGAKIDVDKLVERLRPEDINISQLLSAGADANKLVDKYDQHQRKIGLYGVIQDVSNLLAAGADANKLIEKLDLRAIAYTLDKLRRSGAHIDPDQLVSGLDQEAVAHNLDELLAAGAHIDINHLVDEFDPSVNSRIVDKLLANGVDIGKLINRIQFWAVKANFDKLLAAGADVNRLAEIYVYALREPGDLAKGLDKLIAAGADVSQLVKIMKPEAVFYNLDKLQQAGASVDINQLAEKIGVHHDTLNKLVDAGADVNHLVDVFNPNSFGSRDIIKRLLKLGADVDRLVAKLDSRDISSFLDNLIRGGADARQLAERIEPRDLNPYNFKLLVNAGVDSRELTSRLSKDNVVDLLERMTQRDSRKQ